MGWYPLDGEMGWTEGQLCRPFGGRGGEDARAEDTKGAGGVRMWGIDTPAWGWDERGV